MSVQKRASRTAAAAPAAPHRTQQTISYFRNNSIMFSFSADTIILYTFFSCCWCCCWLSWLGCECMAQLAMRKYITHKHARVHTHNVYIILDINVVLAKKFLSLSQVLQELLCTVYGDVVLDARCMCDTNVTGTLLSLSPFIPFHSNALLMP